MILPPALGAVAGYAYYTYIGCMSGSCPITSDPFIFTAYGALMGAVWVPWNKYILRKQEPA